MTASTDVSQQYDDVVPLYVVLGALSLLSCATLIWVCVKHKALRLHPSSIVLLITLCDLCLALKFFLGAVVWLCSGRARSALSLA